MKRLIFSSLVVYAVGVTYYAASSTYYYWSLSNQAAYAIATEREAHAEQWNTASPVRSSADPPLVRRSYNAVRIAEFLSCCGVIPVPAGAQIKAVESNGPTWLRVVLSNGQYCVYDFVGLTPAGKRPTLADFESTPTSVSLKGGKRPISQLMATGYALGKGRKELVRLCCSYRTGERLLLILRNAKPPLYEFAIHLDDVPLEWVASTEFPELTRFETLTAAIEP